jgi:acyl dehydratase
MATEASNGIYVGRDFGRHDFVVTEDAIATYCAAVDADPARYVSGSSFDRPVAPALLRHSEVYAYRDHPRAQPAWYLPNLYGNLHARQEWELFAPVMAGDAVHTRLFIADRYIKRGRDYVVAEILYCNADDAIVARGRTHQSFLLETQREGMVVDKAREKAPERRVERQELPAMEELRFPAKTITLDMCWRFSGPERSYHNDRDMALKLGFPDVVVQGMMSTCFISEMLTERYGAGWLSAGKMDVRLVNVIWGSDVVTCRGAVREITPEGDRRRARLDVWCEKADGTVVTAGTASALAEA